MHGRAVACCATCARGRAASFGSDAIARARCTLPHHHPGRHSHPSRHAPHANTQLLLIDDWGLEPLEAAHRHDLMEIMDDRHGATSTIVISQLPTTEWYASIGDNTFADAILDRLMHNAHRQELQGESMRKLRADLTHREQLPNQRCSSPENLGEASTDSSWPLH